MSKKALSYVGWLGHQNIGDEAVYFAIRDLLSEYALTPYNSYNFLIENRHRPFLHIEHPISIVSLFGGGTLLPDDVTWIKPNKYNYVFGAGVKDPIFRTKFANFDKTVIDRLKCFNFRFVGVRDKASKLLLNKWGIASEVIGDPALSLKADSKIRRDDHRVAVNIGCDGFLWGGHQERVVHEVTRVCKILKDSSYTPVLVPFSKRDLEDVTRVSLAAKVEVFDNWFDIKSVVDFIASSKVLIGQRLHSVVLSAAVFTPFICLEYRPKCFHFSESVGMSKYTIRTDKVTAEKILQLLQNLIGEWRQTHNELARIVNAYRETQRSFADRIIRDLKLLSDNDWSNANLSSKWKNKLFWETDVFLRKKFYKIWKLYNKLFFSRIIRYIE
ncbi:polysaccharide pyruvyl transferase family protein [Candidatus Bathyarchaeota archaeon]|nr:polysaccharide pyruvyl transferase family protein [Candidatus Bathyarchaeota archaeon]